MVLNLRQSLILVFLFGLAGLPGFVYSQIEDGGMPRSFEQKGWRSGIQQLSILAPDKDSLKALDFQDSQLEKPYRIGVTVPAEIGISNSGNWIINPDGSKIWLVSISCKGAEAIGLDFSSFDLPSGSDLFIYNSNRTHVIGAFKSNENIKGMGFTSRPVQGDNIILEYFQPAGYMEEVHLEIASLLYIYRGFGEKQDRSLFNFGGSGACEVNLNCEEGANWKNQAAGVVRILTRVKNQAFWCTGTVMNNSANDFSPIVLTANHCSESSGNVSSASDLNKWVFYFAYESATCADPIAEPEELSMVGAEKLAASQNPTDIGSDFYLIRLKQDIPASYHTYFNGWSLSAATPSSGVGIHHPQGDIKKISTYSTALGSGTWQSTPNTHWIVKWGATANGFGVTEAGSSGSPLYNGDGLIIGTLTGGESACSNTAATDFYGKISYSWISNGLSDTMQLEPWLDPMNEGRTSMEGAFNDKLAVADFETDTTVIKIGNSLNFYDRSSGLPNLWRWSFEGGEPSSSNEQNPSGIRYNTFGKYYVKLTVTNNYGSDSLVREEYIEVKSLLYPNPTLGEVTLLTDLNNQASTKIEIYSAGGKLLRTIDHSSAEGTAIKIAMPEGGNFFFVKIVQGESVQTEKVVVFHNLD
ncbi:MAG: T9SS type A sorting domain-containing protein [Bacteroidales bacterium]|nr:T9SS type A sorting domain-containing protein [Bacteroidales bacterium]